MKKFTLLLLFSNLLLVLACSEQRSQKSISAENISGITGGHVVLPQSKLNKMVVLVDSYFISTIARIQNGKEEFETAHYNCTGTFIADDIVLTAAHCIKGAPYKMRIIYSADAHNEDAPESAVEKIIVHPDYDKDIIKNDLALLKIHGSKPADYPTMAVTTQAATTESFSIMSIGYGVTSEKAQDSGFLRKVNSTATGYEPTSQVFQIDQSKNTGICYGDSGGPGFIYKDGQYAVLGVVSKIYSSLDEKQEFPCRHYGVYTNVYYYAGWLVSAIDELSGKTHAQ